MAIFGGGLAGVCIAWAGILLMMSMGEPMKVAQARVAVMGAAGGLILVGLAFVIPNAVSEVVIEPMGGAGLVNSPGLDCDKVLKRGLVEQRTASTVRNMQELVNFVQAGRNGCGEESWGPVVKADDYMPSSCFLGSGTALTVDRMPLPASFYRVDGGVTTASKVPGRDSSNNILVYWSDECDERPSDSALCWLYLASLKKWSSSSPVHKKCGGGLVGG